MDDAPAQMTSQRPYLLRALYEWVVDNGMTPHVLVDAQMPGVTVPRHAVKEGQIVLNIADRAVSRLDMGNDSLRFTARFGGVSQAVKVPLYAIIALYARETGQGMALPAEPESPRDAPEEQDAVHSAAPDRQLADSLSETPDGDDPGSTGGPPKRGGHLRIVK